MVEKKPKKLADAPVGTHVRIEGVVVRQQGGGQTLVYFPGVGASGRWSISNSVEFEEVAAAPMTDLQRRALEPGDHA